MKFAHVSDPGAQQSSVPPGVKLFVGSLPREMGKDDALQIFTEFGKVEELHIFTEKDSGQSKGAAFVYMETQEQADAAILALHGKRTIPPMTRPLQVVVLLRTLPKSRGVGSQVTCGCNGANAHQRLCVQLGDALPSGVGAESLSLGHVPPPPPCNSYALVIATVGVGTVLIWYLILIRYKCSAAA